MVRTIKDIPYGFCTYVVVLFLFASGLSAQEEGSSSSITVKYTYVADAFYLMDFVCEASDFPPNQMKEYRDFWEEHYGISEIDQAYIEKYRTIRKKHLKYYFKSETEEYPDNLFPKLEEAFNDPMAQAFFGAADFDQAFDALQIAADDLKELKAFYQHFGDKIKRLIGDSRAVLSPLIQKINDFLHQKIVLGHLEKIRVFYNSIPKEYTARIVWRPAKGGFEFRGCLYNGYLLIQISPEMVSRIETDFDAFMLYMSIIIHESTHGFSQNQPEEQKIRLTKRFLEGSGPLKDIPSKYPRTDVAFFLEEPLVQILSQALFFKAHYPELFDSEIAFYSRHPLVGQYLPLVEPYFNKGRAIDGNLALELGKAYKVLKEQKDNSREEKQS